MKIWIRFYDSVPEHAIYEEHELDELIDQLFEFEDLSEETRTRARRRLVVLPFGHVRRVEGVRVMRAFADREN